jgi:hypothetical protein
MSSHDTDAEDQDGKLRKKARPWIVVLTLIFGALITASLILAAPEIGEYLRALSQPWATLIGGCIVGAGAFLGFRASMKTRDTMERIANRTHGREVMAARQDRYTKIAEQLASEHEPVRLAGVYALAALADEWQGTGDIGQRDVAVKLLCAYLRAKPRIIGARN